MTRPRNRRGRLALLLAFGLSALACAPNEPGTATRHMPPEGGLINDLRARFEQVNPRATRVWIIEVRSAEYDPRPGSKYALLATAWDTSATALEPGHPFGLGELYGVFTTDSALTRVTRTLRIFPTRRWHDYAVRFGTVRDDSIVVLGAGESYGDEAIGLRFDWLGNADSTFTWQAPPRARGED